MGRSKAQPTEDKSTQPDKDGQEDLGDRSSINGEKKHSPLSSSESTAPANSDSTSSSSRSSLPETARVDIPSRTVFDQNGLHITMSFERDPSTPHRLTVTNSYLNSNLQPLTNFDFQISVPKYLTLKILPASSDTVSTLIGADPPIPVTQVMYLENSRHGQRPFLIRFRVNYDFQRAPITTVTVQRALP